MLRKQVVAHPATTEAQPEALPVADSATVLVTSETRDHPMTTSSMADEAPEGRGGWQKSRVSRQ